MWPETLNTLKANEEKTELVKIIKSRESLLTLLCPYPQTANLQDTLVWFVWYFLPLIKSYRHIYLLLLLAK